VLSIWDTKTGKETVMPKDPEHIEHTSVISGLAFSPDGQMLATASLDYSIRLWDLTRRERLTTLKGHLSEVWAIAFSPDGQTLVSGAKDGGVKFWSPRRQKKEDVFTGASLPLAFSKDNRTLVALKRHDGQEAVVFLSLATGEPERQFQLDPPRFRAGPHFGFGPSVALSQDLRILVQGLDDGSVKVWNTETSDSHALKASDHHVDLVALSPDGRILLTSERDQTLRWWNLRDATSGSLETEARKVLFSPDGHTLAAFQRENTIELWDVAARSRRTHLVVEAQLGFSAAFSPDSRLLAVVCQDDSIRLWDVATGSVVGACVGHKQPVFSVAFSPDGKTLASASDDSTMRLWNVATQQELVTDRRLGGGTSGLLFSPDGRLLVAGSGPLSQRSGLRFYRAPALGEIEATTAQAGLKK